MDWIEIITNVFVSLPFVAAGAWVLRESLRLLLDRDLEKFKSDLERESASFKIRYEHLQGERMEVIKTTYQKLVVAFRDISLLVQPSQRDTGSDAGLERKRQASKTATDFQYYFEENKIFFEDDTALEIEKIISQFKEVWFDFVEMMPLVQLSDRKESTQMWFRTWESLQTEVPETKAKLESKFRAIIGIQS